MSAVNHTGLTLLYLDEWMRYVVHMATIKHDFRIFDKNYQPSPPMGGMQLAYYQKGLKILSYPEFIQDEKLIEKYKDDTEFNLSAMVRREYFDHAYPGKRSSPSEIGQYMRDVKTEDNIIELKELPKWASTYAFQRYALQWGELVVIEKSDEKKYYIIDWAIYEEELYKRGILKKYWIFSDLINRIKYELRRRNH